MTERTLPVATENVARGPEVSPSASESPRPMSEPHTPESFERHALDYLREVGLRITTPRIAVIRALSRSDAALNAYEVHAAILASGRKVDVVSVYRILALLRDIGLVHQLALVDGYAACRYHGCEACAPRRPRGPLDEARRGGGPRAHRRGETRRASGGAGSRAGRPPHRGLGRLALRELTPSLTPF